MRFKTRYDYLGLSSDEKPTKKAVNGSTFYETDSSKFFIFYDGIWYEQQVKKGPDVNNQDITITENGVYTADSGYTGFGEVTVDTPEINNQDKEITENGVFTADEGFSGLGQVTVNTPEINNQDKEIIHNGSYSADDGYTGLGTVTVNVPLSESVDGSSMNIFVQEEEPEIKNGIWVQASRTMEHIEIDENIYIEGQWGQDEQYGKLPSDYKEINNHVTAIGTDIYIVSDSDVFKYDTLTNGITSLSSMKYNSNQSCITSVGSTIYMFGGYSGREKYACKYDTLNDTSEYISNVPADITKGSAISIGTDIYLFCNSISYKYDTITDEYTLLNKIPYTFSNGALAHIGNEIYLIGGQYNSQFWYPKMYKYNIDNNSFTKLTDIPYNFDSGGVVVIGTDIYIFGNCTDYRTETTENAYKYDTLTDTYTPITNIPYKTKNVGVAMVGNNIYLLGGSVLKDNNYVYNVIQVFSLVSKEYTENTLVISQGKYKTVGYEVCLFTNKLMESKPIYPFVDAWFYSDHLETDLPTYYGNGSEWVKIKN